PVHDRMSTACEIRRCREQSSVRRNPTPHASILILDFTVNYSLPERLIISSRRYPGFPCRRRIERRLEHSQRPEHLTLTKPVEGFFGHPLKSNSEQDETNVAVLGMRCRGILQGNGEHFAQKFFSLRRAQVDLLVGRQAGAMCEEHAECDVSAARVLTGKFRQHSD